MIVVGHWGGGPGALLGASAQRAVGAGPHGDLNTVVEVREALAGILQIGSGLACSVSTAPVRAVCTGRADGSEEQNGNGDGLHGLLGGDDGDDDVQLLSFT